MNIFGFVESIFNGDSELKKQIQALTEKVNQSEMEIARLNIENGLNESKYSQLKSTHDAFVAKFKATKIPVIDFDKVIYIEWDVKDYCMNVLFEGDPVVHFFYVTPNQFDVIKSRYRKFLS